MRPLPRPMLLRPGPIPALDGWAFELEYDGFRAIVSTEDGLQVRSRRAWNMSDRVPRSGIYRPGFRGWTKIKNPGYSRRESEIELMRRRRGRVKARQSLNPA